MGCFNVPVQVAVMVSPGPSDAPRSFPRGEALVSQASWTDSRQPRLSFPLTYPLTALKKPERVKGPFVPHMPTAPFPGRKWAGLAKLHPIPAAQEKVTGRGEVREEWHRG